MSKSCFILFFCKKLSPCADHEKVQILLVVPKLVVSIQKNSIEILIRWILTHLHSVLVSACFGVVVVVVVVTVVAERTGSWLRLNFSLATSQHSSFSRSLWIIFQISGRVASSSVVKKFSRWSFFFCETAFQILKMRNFFCKVHIRICFERERRLNYQFIF